MSNLSKFSVKRPVTIMMFILIVVIIGIVSLTNITTDLFPSMNLPYALISTTNVGASPEEIENFVTMPLENGLSTVSNVKNITSSSSEHNSIITIEFVDGTNMDLAVIELRETIDLIKGNLPENAGNPMILKITPDMMPVMQVSINKENTNKEELSNFVNNEIINRFEKLSGVGSVSTTGATDNEIHVTLDDDKINAMRLDLTTIEGILQGQNFSMPAGYTNENNIDYLIRVSDKINSMEELKALPLVVTPSSKITLNDIATIEFYDKSIDEYSKVNGENSIILAFQKQSTYATTDVVATINKEIDKINEEFDDVQFTVLLDQAKYINTSVGSVINNLIIGAFLAIVVLFIFLKDIRPTIIIGLSIPISVVATFIMIYASGITMNIVSMSGLALGIGMLVDNAIVVIENIYRLKGKGMKIHDTAIEGAKEVAGPIFASTLTTVSVFLPVIFMKGFTAEIFGQMAFTITFSLFSSLIIALTLVPMMASKTMTKPTKSSKKDNLLRLKKIYDKILDFSLRHKFMTIFAMIVIFIGSILLASSNGYEFMPAGDEGTIMINLNMPSGTEFNNMVESIEIIYDKIDDIKDIDTTSVSLGGNMANLAGSSKESASFNIILKENREKTTTEISRLIEQKLSDLEYETIVRAGDSSGASAMMSSSIDITISGDEFETLEKIAVEVSDIISKVKGTTNIDKGISKGAPEIKVTVNKEKAISKGLTTANVYMTVSKLLSDSKVITNVTFGSDSYDLKVYNSNVTNNLTLKQLKNVTINSPIYGNVKLTDIADVTEESGYAVINRTNQNRNIVVSTEIAQGYNSGKINPEIAKALEEYNTPEGYTVTLGGAGEEVIDSMIQLVYAVALGIVLIYMIMAAQFQSLLYPFIVMMTIPLAFTGGFLGLWITGTPVSIVAILGFVVLAGVVVNNGIVLIDYMNQLGKSNKDMDTILHEAGKTRMRPIFMTALTTILGLTTMALGIGEGAEMMAPMAIATIGGLIYASVLTLTLVPILYKALNRFSKKKNINE
ncbi:MAG: efflux RND transporter permease subunit [Bacilli bacterium]